MNIYPAIDLRAGRVVRLLHGDPARQTIFGDDPIAVARRWAEAGARWLHVVNLDGALDGGTDAAKANVKRVGELARLGPRVQFGGGVRALQDVERLIGLGVERVVLGSIAVEAPDLVSRAVARFGPERIVVGLDARDGRVRVRGWQTDAGISAVELGTRMKARGVELALHTDIGRDGALAGVNAEASAELAQHTGLRVIASGGVASLDDIRRAKAHEPLGVEGMVIGRALYEGAVGLEEALEIADG